MGRNQTFTVSRPGDIKDIRGNFPVSPGVYLYRNKSGEVIYIGKAVNLKNRVSQYFSESDAVGSKTTVLVPQIYRIELHETPSEFDAILLEARLIYAYQPKYNVIAKDDKSPVYVRITFSEEIPMIEFVRKPRNPSYGAVTDEAGNAVFGPFQSAYEARSLLRTIRSVVPYCTQKKRDGKSCFHNHLNLCNPCPSVIAGMSNLTEKRQLISRYRQNLRIIRDILSGKSRAVRDKLERRMRDFADKEEFEEAADLKKRLDTLGELLKRSYNPMIFMSHARVMNNFVQSETAALSGILRKYYPDITSLERIECVDISNFRGQNATGSVVVATGGIIDKKEYRKFRIRSKSSPDDYSMMQEVIKRRFAHSEWTYPDLLIVDGGKGQINAVRETLRQAELRIPVIGIAKRNEEIIIPGDTGFRIVRLDFSDPALRLIMRIRDEAHRFSVSYHRKIRAKVF